MKKKWIYGGLFTLLLSAGIFQNRCAIFGWGCEPTPPPPPTLKGYVVTITNNAGINTAFKNYLTGKGFTFKKACDCSDSTELWDGPVIFNPDTEPPNMFADAGANIASNDSLFFEESPKLGSIIRNNVGKSQISIAITDTGVDTTNKNLKRFLFRNSSNTPFCNSNIFEGLYGMNMLFLLGRQNTVEPIDNDGHGTFINGIIAGFASYPPHGEREAGLPFRMELVNVKIGENRTTGATLFDALCGLHYAINKKVKIINASWGLSPKPDNVNAAGRSFIPVLDKIAKEGMFLVASAGNTGEKNKIIWPASFGIPVVLRENTPPTDYSKNVISVGSWNTQTNTIANHSNRGNNVNLYAPGQDIRSLGLDNSNSEGSNGTSYAAPYVVRRIAQLMINSPTNIGTLKEELMRLQTTQVDENSVLRMTNNTQ